MKSLTTKLLDEGLSLPQIKATLLLIEDWLEENYPVLAKIYHAELIKKDLLPVESALSEKKSQLPTAEKMIATAARFPKVVKLAESRPAYSPLVLPISNNIQNGIVHIA